MWFPHDKPYISFSLETQLAETKDFFCMEKLKLDSYVLTKLTEKKRFSVWERISCLFYS